MTTVLQGHRAPDFTLTDIAGKQRSLSDAIQTGPAVLAFFKVSCPVCQFTFPFLERLHKAIGKQRGTIWAISQDDARDTRDFLGEYDITFPSLIDGEGYPVSNLYGLTNVPTILLAGKDGLVQISFTGFDRSGILKISSVLAAVGGDKAYPVFLPGEPIPDYKPG